LVLYQAVQSLDEGVLKNIKRSTIKLEAYEQLQVHMRGRGLRSVSDLILGLPGESLTTHLAALHKLLNSGIDQLHNFQSMLLKGAEMETIEARKTFGFDSRFRVLPKNFGIYEDEKVFDIEEIVVATATLPFVDYLTARKYHLTSSVFWNDSWFHSLLRFAQSFGVRASEWWDAMLPAMENGSPAVRKFLDDFVSETTNELFPTREACIDFYAQEHNFKRLQAGEIGDNLMYKYRALASFHIWPEVCAAAMEGTQRLLEERGITSTIPHFEEFWCDFHQFVLLQHAHGRTLGEVLNNATANLRYDIKKWLNDGASSDPSAYRLPELSEFQFCLTEEGARELRAALNVWGEELKGLTKMVTRINVAWQVRECRQLTPGKSFTQVA
jgi:hypothetical protein